MKKHEKINWSRIQEDALMRRNGVENYNYKKPLVLVKSINCRFCGERLKNVSEKAETEHLAGCRRYLTLVRDGREKNEFGLYRKMKGERNLSSFRNWPDFPFSVLGQILKTPKTTGKVVSVSDDGKKLTIVNDIGLEHTFLIELLMKLR